ncbi:MAG: ABC transporter permease [Patescibacteria group bacterium]
MKINETLKTSLDSLALNKVRSFLTMLGVIIGVFAVVTLISLVKGVENYIEDQFKLLGANTVYVMPGKISTGGTGQNTGAGLMSGKLKEKHVDLIETYAKDYIDAVTPSVETSKSIKYKTKEYYAGILGVNYQGTDIFNMEILYGRHFSKLEQMTKSRVTVLGYSVNEELFNNENSIGQKVKIDAKTYEVIGVMEKKGPSFDGSVVVPYTAVIQDFDGRISSIAAKAKADQDLELVVQQIKIALMKDLKKDDFSVLTQKDFMESINSILDILTVALGAIAGISLLVGGIGIMNIELVSVTERTREIGLRKALGATSKNIKLQFMTEAVLISVAGGVVGLLLGWLATFAMRSFVRAEIPTWSILLSLGFSAFVGVAFGTYPAIKASQKDPIQALRYE